MPSVCILSMLSLMLCCLNSSYPVTPRAPPATVSPLQPGDGLRLPLAPLFFFLPIAHCLSVCPSVCLYMRWEWVNEIKWEREEPNNRKTRKNQEAGSPSLSFRLLILLHCTSHHSNLPSHYKKNIKHHAVRWLPPMKSMPTALFVSNLSPPSQSSPSSWMGNPFPYTSSVILHFVRIFVCKSSVLSYPVWTRDIRKRNFIFMVNIIQSSWKYLSLG